MKVGDKVIAAWDFTARYADELNLEEDDIITIIDLEENRPGAGLNTGSSGNTWAMGDLNGQRGWFPIAFVRLLDDQQQIQRSLTNNGSLGALTLGGAGAGGASLSQRSLASQPEIHLTGSAGSSSIAIFDNEDESEGANDEIQPHQQHVLTNNNGESGGRGRRKGNSNPELTKSRPLPKIESEIEPSSTESTSVNSPISPASTTSHHHHGRKHGSSVVSKVSALFSYPASPSPPTPIDPSALKRSRTSAAYSTKEPIHSPTSPVAPKLVSARRLSASNQVTHKRESASSTISTTSNTSNATAPQREFSLFRRSNVSATTSSDNLSNSSPNSTLIGTHSISTGTVVISAVVQGNGPSPVRRRWKEEMQGKIDFEKLSKKQINRQEVIHELTQTESDYIEDLKLIQDLYIKNIKKNGLLSNKDISVIFSNIEQILPVNEEFLKSLLERQKDQIIVDQIGDIILRMSDYFKMYTLYCSNHPQAVMKLKSISSRPFLKFLEQSAANPASKSMELSHYLIKPVQRICKYPLLIKEIIKNTDDDHPDRKNLDAALLKIGAVVTIVNEAARQTENVFRMLDLQSKLSTKATIVAPSRVLIKECQLELVKKGGTCTKRKVYIFNDLLMMIKEAMMSDKYNIKAKISYDDISVVDPNEGNSHEPRGEKNDEEGSNVENGNSGSGESVEDDRVFIIYQSSTNESYALQAESKKQKKELVKMLQNLIYQFKDRNLSRLRENMTSIKPSSAASPSSTTTTTTTSSTAKHAAASASLSVNTGSSANESSSSSLVVPDSVSPVSPGGGSSKSHRQSTTAALKADKKQHSNESSSRNSNTSLKKSNSNIKLPTSTQNDTSDYDEEKSPTSDGNRRPSHNDTSLSGSGTLRKSKSSLNNSKNSLKASLSSLQVDEEGNGSQKLKKATSGSNQNLFKGSSTAINGGGEAGEKTTSSGNAFSRSASRERLENIGRATYGAKSTNATATPAPTTQTSHQHSRNQHHSQNEPSASVATSNTIAPISNTAARKGHQNNYANAATSNNAQSNNSETMFRVSSKGSLQNNNNNDSQDFSSNNLNGSIIESTIAQVDETFKSSRAAVHNGSIQINTGIKNITLVDVFRPPGTKKDYIYVTEVERPTDSYCIFLTFDDFFDFHMQLISHFPEESGILSSSSGTSNSHAHNRDSGASNNSESNNNGGGGGGFPSAASNNSIAKLRGKNSSNSSLGSNNNAGRIIPDFPSQIMFVSETVAKDRKRTLSQYMRSVLELPPKISRSYVLGNFLKKDGKRVLAIQKLASTGGSKAHHVSS